VKKCHRALLRAEDGPSFGYKKRHLSFDSGVNTFLTPAQPICCLQLAIIAEGSKNAWGCPRFGQHSRFSRHGSLWR
jgi:hypothetical protein